MQPSQLASTESLRLLFPELADTDGPILIPPSVLELPALYTARARPEYFVDSIEVTGGVTWQPDVYEMAAAIARACASDTIVDIGCGRARKLVALHPEFRLVGVDYGDNIAWCRRTYGFGSWLEIDLERHEPLPIPSPLLGRSVVVCSDVIEHLINPRALLAILFDLLEQARYVLLTTPDRVRTHGADHRGPPPNPAHTREWTTEELVRLCELEGFQVLAAGHTRSNNVEPDLATACIVLTRRQSLEDASVIEAAAEAGLALLAPRACSPGGLIQSVQTTALGEPRFTLAGIHDVEDWGRLAEAEADGGIEPQARVFLDAQLESTDLLLDLAPGAGFVALSAATAPGGAPTVLVYGGDAWKRECWREAARAAGRSLIAGDPLRLALLAEDIRRHLRRDARVFAHVSPSNVSLLLQVCEAVGAAAQLVAVCLTPDVDAHGWEAAVDGLVSSGFALHQLVDQHGEVMLQRVVAPSDEHIIAIPTALLDAPVDLPALPAAS